MPLQCQLAALKLDALVHMVICNQLPVLEFHQKEMEFPWINSSGVRLGRIHHIRSRHNSRRHAIDWVELAGKAFS
jgi:hypothetical protein